MTLYRYCYATFELEVLTDGQWRQIATGSPAIVPAVLGVALPLRWDAPIEDGVWDHDHNYLGTRCAGVDREMLTRYFVTDES